MNIFIALLILLLLCIVLFVVFIPYVWSTYRDAELILKIPGPHSLPILGNAYHVIGKTKEEYMPFVANLFKTYHPMFRWHFFGHRHVVIKELEDIEKILNNSQHISKSFDYYFLQPWLRTGLLTSTGSKWHARRKLLTPAFHFKILEDYVPVFNRNSAVFAEKLREHLNDTYIPINNFTTLCTLDIICETAMGTQINSQQGQASEYVHAVQRISELFQLRQLTFWLYNDSAFKFSPEGLEQVRVLKTLHDFTKKVIHERRAEYRENKRMGLDNNYRKKRLAFLDLLIEVSENGEQLTDADIQEEVDTFMFEGHDTTSAALAWAIHLLGSHLDVQNKAIEEQDEIFGDSDRPATYEDLQQMRYLERVVKETLRMYPSVPGFSRKLDIDIELSGYTIPAGTNIPIMTCMIHRDSRWFPNPDKFDPDRFLPEVVQGRHPFAYLPFSAGPRNCIGQRFALLEEKAMLSSVLRNFRVHSHQDNASIKPLMELILRPKTPLLIKIFPRK